MAIAAFVTHGVARSFLEDAMRRKAAALSQAAKHQTPYVVDPLALHSSQVYNILTGAGVALTALSALCMAIAALRREPGWYLILLLLLFFDISGWMMLG